MRFILKPCDDVSVMEDILCNMHDSFIKYITIISHDRYELEDSSEGYLRGTDPHLISFLQIDRRDIEVAFICPAASPVIEQTIIAKFYNVRDVFLSFRVPRGCDIDDCIRNIHIRAITLEHKRPEDNAGYVLIVEQAYCCCEWFICAIPLFRFEWAEFETKPDIHEFEGHHEES